MKFYEREDCVTVSPYVDAYGTKSGVFLFKNIIKPELVEKIESGLKGAQNELYKDTLISWYSEKLTPSVDGLIEVWEQIGDIIGPDWVIHPQNNLLSVKPGDNGMFIHSDSPGKGMCHLLSQVDVWSTCCELDYGVVAYFGEYEGGEIFYPNINPDGTLKTEDNDVRGKCLEFKPERGDLVIHSAFDPYAHGVREVTSGIRYAYSNFSLKAIDNPGTFYNYGTPEYYEQIGNKSPEDIKRWMRPLIANPQFTDEKIREYQSAGVEGEKLSEKFFQHVDKEEFRKHLKKQNNQ